MLVYSCRASALEKGLVEDVKLWSLLNVLFLRLL